VADVVRVEPLTPGFVRITLGGDDLAELAVEEPGEILTLLWPAPGAGLVLPGLGWTFPPGVAERQHARNYTVRRWDASTRQVVVDFVLHGDEGIASAWAARARPGDTVGFAGPRVHWKSHLECDWTLLVADETGLPALAAIAETLPPEHRALAVVEVAGPREEQPIRSPARLEVRWAHRGDAPPGSTRVLERALRSLDVPDGQGRAWGAAESTVMRRVRRSLRERWRLPASHVSALGYWVCAGDH
jgi:NADPH-dependent ferric siderophore reductase